MPYLFCVTRMRTTNLHLPSAAMKNDVITTKGGGVSMVGKYRFTYGRL